MKSQNFEQDQLKKRALSGLIFLGIRRIVFQIILTGGNIILARLLFPADFGAFAIAAGIVSLVGIFSSLGLESALIQKKDEPTRGEIQATFTTSLLLSTLSAFLIIVLAPLFASFYESQLGERGVFYLRILSLSLIALGLKGVSSSLLERNLNYFRLTLGEILEVLILQSVTVVLALAGFGVMSFIWGALVSRALGFLIFFALSPWPINFRIPLGEMRGILSFGINYQLNMIIGGLNGAVVPIFVGKVSGAAGVGFLNWAGGLATLPRAIPEILGRITFPVGSRAQGNPRQLRLLIEKAIQLSSLTSFPLIAILIALARPITYLIYTDRWLPGIPALYFFSLQSIFVILGGIFTQTLLALGQAKTVRNISLFWAILQWILTVPLVFRFGFTGLAIAGAIVSSTLFVPMIVLRRRIEFSVASHVWPYLVYALSAGFVAYALNLRYPAQSLFGLIFSAGIGGLVYLILIFIFKSQEILEDLRQVKQALF